MTHKHASEVMDSDPVNLWDCTRVKVEWPLIGGERPDSENQALWSPEVSQISIFLPQNELLT